MNGHSQDWIEAYSDDALSPDERRQAERHLAGCASCRQLLEQHRKLASLLQAAPPAAPLKSERQFVSEISLQMDRQPARPSARASWAWMAIPAALFLAWGFVEAAVIVASLAGLFPGIGQPSLDLVNRLMPLLPLVTGSGGLAGWLSSLGFFDWLPWTASILLLVIGVLYASWLAAWWTHHRPSQDWNVLERN